MSKMTGTHSKPATRRGTLSAPWHEATKSGNAAVFLHFCNLKEVDEDGNLPIAGNKKKVRT